MSDKRSPPALFVQHVPKTAGTALMTFLEPNYPSNRMHTSQQIWQAYPQTSRNARPYASFLAVTPPGPARQIQYAHGHYRDLFRQALFPDYFSIGTSRNVDERLISLLNHAARDAGMDRRLIRYLAGESLSPEDVLKSLIQSSQFSFYATQMFLLGKTNHLKSIRSEMQQMALQAERNLETYDSIMDMADLNAHCARLAEYLPHPHNFGRHNCRREFTPSSEYRPSHLRKLRADFPEFFELEDAFYAKLHLQSRQTLLKPLEDALEAQGVRHQRGLHVLPECANVSGMSRRVPVSLPGWEGEFYRTLAGSSTIHELPLYPGRYQGFLWFWCADPERSSELQVSVSGVADFTSRVWLIELPSRHLWIQEVGFSSTRVQTVDMTFRDESGSASPAMWLGAKLSWYPFSPVTTEPSDG